MASPGMRYVLPSREVIADAIEIMLEAHAFDAVVLVAGGDKVVPGMVMGALRAASPRSVCIRGRRRSAVTVIAPSPRKRCSKRSANGAAGR